MAAERPILAIGPTDGDVAKIMEETQAGEIVDYDDLEKLKKCILTLIEPRLLKGDTEAVNKYSREELTKKLVEILNNF